MDHHAHHIMSLTGTAAFFLFGLFGSLHCLGMCGPLSSLFLFPTKQKRSTAIALYHVSRAIAYAALGYGLHAVGRSVDYATSIPLTLFITVIPLSLYALGLSFPLPALLKRLQYRAMALTRSVPVNLRAIAVGFFTPLLPCGLLYGALAFAVHAPTQTQAALWMTSFATGTIPLLALGQSGIHWIASRLSATGLRYLYRLLAALAATSLVIFYIHHRSSI